MITSDNEIQLKYAWAAGLIDGEATFYLNKQGSGTLNRLEVHMNDRQTLETLRDILQCGEVNLRDTPKNENTNQAYLWQISKRSSLKWVLARILPYMVTKRKSAEILFDFLLAAETYNVSTNKAIKERFFLEFDKAKTRSTKSKPRDSEPLLTKISFFDSLVHLALHPPEREKLREEAFKAARL